MTKAVAARRPTGAPPAPQSLRAEPDSVVPSLPADRMAMNISVGCRSRSGASEPARLCLGQCSLRVVSVRQLPDPEKAVLYEARVMDGRRFVLRQIARDHWELKAIYRGSRRLDAHQGSP